MIDEELSLRDSLERRPGNIDICQRLVKLLRDRDELGEAFTILKTTAQKCLEQGRFSHGIDLIETMLEVRPDYMQAHVEIGKPTSRSVASNRPWSALDWPSTAS